MKRFVVLSMVVMMAAVAGADEGMWVPSQLPELGERMKTMGLQTPAGELADLTGHPMGAVIWLGGCTASFVSDQGLVVTNHHCAHGSIQHNSTEENNLLENGFVAGSLEEELPASPGTRIYVATEVEDVTDTVLGAVPEGATGAERYDAIEAAEKKLVAACEEQSDVRCRVASFYGGLEYKLYTQLEIRDVRLVYAPPLSVGNYGGDVDNWMWPRHTGDFSMYRAYVGPDGRPADPSSDNVPYRPEHWLQVSTEGVADGDFVMVAGYPGGTSRYRLADEVRHTMSWYYPTAKRLIDDMIDEIEAATADDPEARLKYDPMLQGLNNASKNFQGQLEGFAGTGIPEAKEELERELQSWIEADPERRAAYGSALTDLKALVAESNAESKRKLYMRMLGWGGRLMVTADRLYRLSREREKPDIERERGFQERDLSRFRQGLQRMEMTFDPDVDRRLMRHAILKYADHLEGGRIPEFDAWFGITDEGVDEAKLDQKLQSMYEATELDDMATRLELMSADRAELEASEDPFIQLAVATYDADRRLEEEAEALSGRFKEARPRFMEALIAFKENRGELVYPDANSTLRVTFGTVDGYSPRDGVFYLPFTTLAGIAEKHTGEDPFDASDELLEAIAEDEGRAYTVDELGAVPVDFLSSVDTTGGNSGSPTLNGRSELVGLLFDGAWESIVSDWFFEAEKVRSIHADVRYLLWYLDRIEDADRLLEEMGVEPVFEVAE